MQINRGSIWIGGRGRWEFVHEIPHIFTFIFTIQIWCMKLYSFNRVKWNWSVLGNFLLLFFFFLNKLWLQFMYQAADGAKYSNPHLREPRLRSQAVHLSHPRHVNNRRDTVEDTGYRINTRAYRRIERRERSSRALFSGMIRLFVRKRLLSAAAYTRGCSLRGKGAGHTMRLVGKSWHFNLTNWQQYRSVAFIK